MTWWRSERGQATAEYAALLGLVALVIGALAAVGLDRPLAGAAASLPCVIAGGCGGGSDARAAAGGVAGAGASGPARAGGGGALGLLGRASGARSGVARGITTRADALDRAARRGRNPTIRVRARRSLPRAERLARSRWVRVAGRVPWLSGALSVASNRARGRSWLESGARTGLTMTGGSAGSAAGAAACGAESVVTAGVGALACPVLIAGGGTAGGYVGNKLGDWIFGG
jgi:hypothetical protein